MHTEAGSHTVWSWKEKDFKNNKLREVRVYMKRYLNLSGKYCEVKGGNQKH